MTSGGEEGEDVSGRYLQRIRRLNFKVLLNGFKLFSKHVFRSFKRF